MYRKLNTKKISAFYFRRKSTYLFIACVLYFTKVVRIQIVAAKSEIKLALSKVS